MSAPHSAEPQHFVVCVRNDGYPAALEPRKLYPVLPDPDAEAMNQLRVVDESGEDYLYPADYFLSVPLPERVEEMLRRAS